MRACKRASERACAHARLLQLPEYRAGHQLLSSASLLVQGVTAYRFAVGLLWGNLARDPPRRLVVAEERSGTLGGGLDAVAVRGEAAPAPQAHRTAPHRPRYSLDQLGLLGLLGGRLLGLGVSFQDGRPSTHLLGLVRTRRAPSNN